MVVKFWALCNWVLACVFIWMKSETVWTVEITKCYWLVYVNLHLVHKISYSI